MVQLVENQPDAYTYRLFGKRVLLGCLLAALILAISAVLITVVTLLTQIVSFVMSLGDYPSGGIVGIFLGFFFFIVVGFLPLIWIVMFIARIYRKWYKRLELDRSGPAGMITGARISLLLMSTLAVTPLALAISDPQGSILTVLNFYQHWFLRLFFSLLGLAILLLFLAPAMTLHKRTQGRGLYLAGILAVIAGGLIIFHANQVWSISATDLASGNASFDEGDNLYWSDQGQAGTFDEGDSLWLDEDDDGVYGGQDKVLRGNPRFGFTRGQEVITGDGIPFTYDDTDKCEGSCKAGDNKYQDGQDIYEEETLSSLTFTGGSHALVDADGSATKQTGSPSSISTGSKLREFRESYWAVMLSAAGLLLLAGMIMRRNAGSILRQQRHLFVTRLEG